MYLLNMPPAEVNLGDGAPRGAAPTEDPQHCAAQAIALRTRGARAASRAVRGDTVRIIFVGPYLGQYGYTGYFEFSW